VACQATVAGLVPASHFSIRLKQSRIFAANRPGWSSLSAQPAVCWLAVIEAPLAFLNEPVEVDFRNTVSAQIPLGLVPEVFDAVDVVGAIDKGVLVVDALVVEFGNIENVEVAIG